MVAAASAGTAAVRKKDPAHYPVAPHAYYRLGDHELHAPLLCAACFERVEPNNLFQVCPHAHRVRSFHLRCTTEALLIAWGIAYHGRLHIAALLDLPFPYCMLMSLLHAAWLLLRDLWRDCP